MLLSDWVWRSGTDEEDWFYEDRFQMAPRSRAGLVRSSGGGAIGLVLGSFPSEGWDEVEPSSAFGGVYEVLSSARIRPVVGRTWGASVAIPVGN